MPSPVKSKLAQTLTHLRGELSLYEVSKSIGINRGALFSYEQGKKVPSDKNLKIIATFYNADFNELKMLIFEEAFPAGSQDRELLIQWVQRII